MAKVTTSDRLPPIPVGKMTPEQKQVFDHGPGGEHGMHDYGMHGHGEWRHGGPQAQQAD